MMAPGVVVSPPLTETAGHAAISANKRVIPSVDIIGIVQAQLGQLLRIVAYLLLSKWNRAKVERRLDESGA